MDNVVTSAQELYERHDYAAAATAFQEQLAQDPANAVAWKNYGLCLVLTDRAEEGIEACKKAYDLQPGSAEIRYALGYAYGAIKKYEEAIAELDAALYLDPMNANSKQSLLYCLVQHGASLANSDDPRLAEPYLDRARKIAPESPNTIAPLLKLFIETRQPMKAVRLANDIPAKLKSDPTIEPLLKTMEADTEFSTHMKMASAAAQPKLQAPGAGSAQTGAPPPPVQTGIVYVGCPNCKQQISALAFICPHCNFRIKESGTFAGRDVGPAYCWQDVALTIISSIMIITVLVDGFRIAAAGSSVLAPYFLTIDAVQLFLAVGCLLRWDMVMTVAKYLMYLPLLTSGLGVMVGFMMGNVVAGLLSLVQLALIGFFVYLLSWASD